MHSLQISWRLNHAPITWLSHGRPAGGRNRSSSLNMDYTHKRCTEKRCDNSWNMKHQNKPTDQLSHWCDWECLLVQWLVSCAGSWCDWVCLLVQWLVSCAGSWCDWVCLLVRWFVTLCITLAVISWKVQISFSWNIWQRRSTSVANVTSPDEKVKNTIVRFFYLSCHGLRYLHQMWHTVAMWQKYFFLHEIRLVGWFSKKHWRWRPGGGLNIISGFWFLQQPSEPANSYISESSTNSCRWCITASTRKLLSTWQTAAFQSPMWPVDDIFVPPVVITCSCRDTISARTVVGHSL